MFDVSQVMGNSFGCSSSFHISRAVLPVRAICFPRQLRIAFGHLDVRVSKDFRESLRNLFALCVAILQRLCEFGQDHRILYTFFKAEQLAIIRLCPN
jgi:hypothetical protein